MSTLKYKTRGNSTPQGKPRVYFCCHRNDFDKYFDEISDEILAKQNCAIWYVDELVEHNEELFFDLKQMQLFVMPITTNLLCSSNEALDIEFKFAVENHIPVLPLMQENGLIELFNEKCGELEFLDKYNTDMTAISYDEKLEKYLSSVLIDDKLAEKIRAAFDAYVFLSYRKKDRKYAQELMHLIHKNDFCRDIAIWYDEFLTPGENFNDSIKAALQKSELFVLAVTPNLVSESNYIMTTEYPMARKNGKIILPAELVPTDRKKLSEQYEGIPAPTDVHNEAELSEALLESIKKIAVKENDVSPEHNFFIGLAYLNGIDVEVDYERAVSLITISAEAGLQEAMKKLADMYFDGFSVQRDVDASIYWYRRLINLQEEAFGITNSKNDAMKLLNSYDALGGIYEQLHQYANSIEMYRQGEIICEECIKSEESDTCFLREQCHFLNRLSYALKLAGDYTEAYEKLNKAYVVAINLESMTGKDYDLLQRLRCQIRMGEIVEEQFNYNDALIIYNEVLGFLRTVGDTSSFFYLSVIHNVYLKIGDIYCEINDCSKALDNYRKAFEVCNRLSVERGTITDKLNVAITHNKIGHVLVKTEEDCDAMDEYLASYKISTELYDVSATLDVQRQLMLVSSHLAGINCSRKNYELAEELYQDALEISKKMVSICKTVEAYRDMRVSCDNLASLYEKTEDLTKAFSLRFVEVEAAQKAADITNSQKDLMCLTISYNNLANFLRMSGKVEDALSQYLNAYKLRKIMSEQSNPETLKALSYSCDCIAETYKTLGDMREARVYYKEAVEICEKLLSQTVSIATLDSLGTSYVNLASVEDGIERRNLLVRAVEIYNKLCTEEPHNQRFKNDLAVLKEGVEDMGNKSSRKSGFFRRLFGK